MIQDLRVAFNALDLALYRRVRSLAHTPQIVLWVRATGRRRPIVEDLPHLMVTPTGLGRAGR